MNFRRSLLLAEESITAAGTKTIEIKNREPISRITFAWRTTKSKDGNDAAPCQDITKIELVDGSDVLHSLDGGSNQALAIFSRRVPTMNHGQQILGNSSYSTYAIDFGRKLWDRQLAFDPLRFRNPQLKISHNLAVSDTGVTAAYLEVWGDLFDEGAIAPQGFLSAKEQYKYTTGAAASHEYIDLPTDRLIRQILLRGYYKGYEPWYSLIEAKLDVNNDSKVLFDMDLEDWTRMCKGIDLMVQETIQAYVYSSETTFYCTPTDYYATMLGIGTAADKVVAQTTYGRGGKFVMDAETTEMVNGLVFGWCPNSCFRIPFGDIMELDDALNPSEARSLRLRLKAGTAGTSGGGQVITEQIRPY